MGKDWSPRGRTLRVAAALIALCLLLAACSDGGSAGEVSGGPGGGSDKKAPEDAVQAELSVAEAPADEAPADEAPESEAAPEDTAAPAPESEPEPEAAEPTMEQRLLGRWREGADGDRYWFEEDGVFTYAAADGSSQSLRYSTGRWFIEDGVLMLSASSLGVREGGSLTRRDLAASARIVEDYPLSFPDDGTALLDDIRLVREEDMPTADLESFRDDAPNP